MFGSMNLESRGVPTELLKLQFNLKRDFKRDFKINPVKQEQQQQQDPRLGSREGLE